MLGTAGAAAGAGAAAATAGAAGAGFWAPAQAASRASASAGADFEAGRFGRRRVTFTFSLAGLRAASAAAAASLARAGLPAASRSTRARRRAVSARAGIGPGAGRVLAEGQVPLAGLRPPAGGVELGGDVLHGDAAVGVLGPAVQELAVEPGGGGVLALAGLVGRQLERGAGRDLGLRPLPHDPLAGGRSAGRVAGPVPGDGGVVERAGRVGRRAVDGDRLVGLGRLGRLAGVEQLLGGGEGGGRLVPLQLLQGPARSASLPAASPRASAALACSSSSRRTRAAPAWWPARSPWTRKVWR